MRTRYVLVVAALTLAGASALDAASAPRTGMKRTELQRHDLGTPGREVVQVRVDLDPGVAFGRHWHPGEEIVYVLEGALEYQIDGKPAVTLRAGDVLFIPARTVHSARNVGKDNGAELATYVVDKGKPLVVMVP
jgi:quercetin dioxygenase-like cupin family protein